MTDKYAPIKRQIDSLRNEGFYSQECTEPDKIANTMRLMLDCVRKSEAAVYGSIETTGKDAFLRLAEYREALAKLNYLPASGPTCPPNHQAAG